MRRTLLGSACALTALVFCVLGCSQSTERKSETPAKAVARDSRREAKHVAASPEPAKNALQFRQNSFADAADFCDPSGAAPAERCVVINGGNVGAAAGGSEAEGLALSIRRPDEGVGPGQGGDKYSAITENPFRTVTAEPFSTFSIDVDTASYSKVRMYLTQANMRPPLDAVRIEELINYFDYSYTPPHGEHPFAVHTEVGICPWQPQHKLVRIGLKGREIERKQRPISNLVFLIDTSGSMQSSNKLPLVKQGLAMLTRELGPNDRVSIVVYAGSAGQVLPSTSGSDQATILAALDRLAAGGSTNGGQGIQLAYRTARENFIKEGVNRVILCSDGDFNVGTTNTGDLVRLAETNANEGVFLTVLGFGMGNHNDAMLEQLSDKANGNYAFVDTEAEAHKVLVEQMSGTLVTIAKDVKIQVEFNPKRVANYRLLGYENRILATEDFNNDKKDAGEIGAGHVVTALYEVTPADEKASAEVLASVSTVDPLKYQVARATSAAADSGELLTVKLRYKQPTADESTYLDMPVKDGQTEFSQGSSDFQFAAAVASFGMLLRNSEHKGNWTYDAVLEVAQANSAKDPHGYRAEFIELVKRARDLGRTR